MFHAGGQTNSSFSRFLKNVPKSRTENWRPSETLVEFWQTTVGNVQDDLKNLSAFILSTDRQIFTEAENVFNRSHTEYKDISCNMNLPEILRV